MQRSILIPLLAVVASLTLTSCAAVEAQRQAQEAKRQEFVTRVDTAHVWVTPNPPPSGKPFDKLGDLTYTEPFSPDAIDEAKINARLKQMALAKWPDTIDAIVNVNQNVSNDGSSVTVTGEAIQYQSSVDRNALHHMNEGLIASPSGN